MKRKNGFQSVPKGLGKKNIPRDLDWRNMAKCKHFFDNRLCCDGHEHYYPCVMKDCNGRQYFCKHTQDDRHCPQSRMR